MPSPPPYAERGSPSRPRQPARMSLAALLPGSDPGVLVDGITADSRLVQPGDLYVGLPGHTVHGARFVTDAVAAGAVAVLTDRAGAELAGSVPVPVVIVDSPRAQLAALAAQVYGHPATRLAMIGLTGTNGKTTTSLLVAAATRAAGLRTGVIGTLGFTLDGQPLPGIRTTVTTPEAPELQALLAVMAQDGADVVVMEVSSHALALGRADEIVFDVAGFTNFGSDHLDFHGDLESYFEAKAQLFTAARARRVVLNVDDPRGPVLADRAAAEGVPVTTVSLTGPADYTLKTHPVEVAMPGDYNLRNALTALALVEAVGADRDRAVVGLADAVVPGRMQPVDLGPGAPAVVVDFAHTPQAVTAALTALAGRRRLVVLGCGGDRDAAKREPMGAAATTAEVVVVTDDNPRSEDPGAIRATVLAGAYRAATAGQQVLDGGDRRSAIRAALELAGPDDVVAVLGKGHESGQEIAGRTEPFDDVTVARDEWAALAGGVA